MRTFSQNIPSNHCSFKDRGQKRVNITNACTIDYFLLSLWTSTQINNNFLKECEKKGGIYFDLFEIIKLIDIGDWPKAKHHWLTKCLQMKETESNLVSVTFNCFGAINDYFIKKMSSLQTYKLRTRSCAQVEPIVEDKSLTTFGLTFFDQVNKPKCNTKCGKCSWQEITFDSDPIWLVHEVVKEEEKSISL